MTAVTSFKAGSDWRQRPPPRAVCLSKVLGVTSPGQFKFRHHFSSDGVAQPLPIRRRWRWNADDEPGQSAASIVKKDPDRRVDQHKAGPVAVESEAIIA